MLFQFVTFNQGMKSTKLVTVFLLLFANISIAQATVYNIYARFSDGGIQGETLFNGQYDWDGSTVSSFRGELTQAMWAWDENNGKYDTGRDSSGNIGAPPVLDLTYQLGGLSTLDADGDVSVSVFLINDTNVYSGGGYTLGDSLIYGFNDGNTPNENAYFTLAFNAADPTNTQTALDKIVYGDGSPFGLMGGILAMTGHSSTVTGFNGSMGGLPTDLTITTVPVPAAVWLFGSALAGMIGVSRKRIVVA